MTSTPFFVFKKRCLNYSQILEIVYTADGNIVGEDDQVEPTFTVEFILDVNATGKPTKVLTFKDCSMSQLVLLNNDITPGDGSLLGTPNFLMHKVSTEAPKLFETGYEHKYTIEQRILKIFSESDADKEKEKQQKIERLIADRNVQSRPVGRRRSARFKKKKK